jgi:hypothetical protein
MWKARRTRDVRDVRGRAMSQKPLAIDLFCGLGGWTEGLLAAGYYVVGFYVELHQYGDAKYPAQLVIQDVLTLHGRQFKDAALIVASPPCQEFSYMAMPWSKAKAKERDLLEGRDDPKRLTALFDACFRIQREACEAAGHHIPLVVENVRGAQKWVGRSRWNYGSFHLWGDVPALMPMAKARQVLKDGITHRSDGSTNFHGHTKNNGGSWFNIGSPGQKVTNRNPVHELAGTKQAKSGRAWFADPDSISGSTSSKSTARKAASAAIAKIPFPLAQHIAHVYFPRAA